MSDPSLEEISTVAPNRSPVRQERGVQGNDRAKQVFGWEGPDFQDGPVLVEEYDGLGRDDALGIDGIQRRRGLGPRGPRASRTARSVDQGSTMMSPQWYIQKKPRATKAMAS